MARCENGLKNWAMLMVVVLATALGCGPESPAALQKPEIAEEDDVIVCNQYTNVYDRELYVRSAINAKLQHFPELAEALGMQSVSSCEQARSYTSQYAQYSAVHPHFDADEPLNWVPDFPDPPVGGPEPSLKVPKIQGGRQAQFVATGNPAFDFPNNPVVDIYWTDSTIEAAMKQPAGRDPAGECSGYFISKNWLVTAAHCLPIVVPDPKRPGSGVPPPTPGQPTLGTHLSGYAAVQWRFRWADAAGNTVHMEPRELIVDARDLLQVADPNWTSSKATTVDSRLNNRDFGLIYFGYKTYDRWLAPRLDTGAAMRISISPPRFPSNILFAGYSLGVQGALQPDPALRVGQAILDVTQPYDFAFQAPILETVAAEPAMPSDPIPPNQMSSLCVGDSGGPAYQLAGSPATTPVVYGTNQAFTTNRSGAVCGTFIPGDPKNWEQLLFTRNDIQIDFIETQVRRRVPPGPRCQRLPFAGVNGGQVLQCFGDPCKTTADCNTNGGPPRQCWRPGSELEAEFVTGIGLGSACPLCDDNPTEKGCDCIRGQCVPANTL